MDDAEQPLPLRPSGLQLAALTLGPPKPGRGGDGAGAMLAAHRKWLSECTAAASVGSILSPLVELIHDPSSAEVALELWVLAFMMIGHMLDVDERITDLQRAIDSAERELETLLGQRPMTVRQMRQRWDAKVHKSQKSQTGRTRRVPELLAEAEDESGELVATPSNVLVKPHQVVI